MGASDRRFSRHAKLLAAAKYVGMDAESRTETVPTVVMAPSLARWLTAAPGANVREVAVPVAGGTVRAALEALFTVHPQLRSYVVDEHGTLRHHVVAFVNGEAVRDKQRLDDAVAEDGEIHLFQALSGG
jgi:molybdopterin synthase sulfur carrier subunit